MWAIGGNLYLIKAHNKAHLSVQSTFYKCHKSADKKRPPLVEFDLEQGWSVIQLRIFVFVSTTIFRCVLKHSTLVGLIIPPFASKVNRGFKHCHF
jgi:hypothetical protein